MRRLEGRVAIVTGSARGIGAATAKKLASEGAKVAIVDLNEASCETVVQEIKNAGGEALAVGCDVSQVDQVNAAVEKVVAHFGKLDILVNNAGITRDALLFKMTDEEWDMVINVHLKGTFLFCRAAQKYMVEQKYGKIVNTSSIAANGNRGQTNYSAAKAGIQGMTRTLAIELGPFNINVNCVAPGGIATDMTRDLAKRLNVDFEELKAQAAKTVPLRRMGEPEDIANVVAFLVSDEASYVTGEIITVGGGIRQ